MYDVVIIGAGIVGSLIAREFSKYQLNVCVIEKENDVARGSSGANSGISHAGFDAKPGTLKAKLNVRGSRMMEKLCRQLGVNYERNGALVLGFNEEDEATINKLYNQGVQNGVRNLKIIYKDEIKKLEPSISDKAVVALLANDSGIVSPYNLAISAMGNAMDNGVEFITNTTVNKIVQSEKSALVLTDKGDFEAKLVINSAGLYSDVLSNDPDIVVKPRKGEYMLLDKNAGGMISHTIFVCPSKMGKGILVSPTTDGNVILGPTAVDIDDKENTETTAEGLKAVSEGARKSVPDIPLRKVITSFAGLRAVGNTGDFIIKFSSDNLITLAGIESPGLTSSPAIAEYVVDMAKSTGFFEMNKKHFKSKRVIYKASKEKYNNIICRCETISEGEIISAIHSNPPALDVYAVKKRVRSGMGRCQGGFCMPGVAEIISRETGIPIEKVTKSGRDTYILLEKIKEGLL